MSTEADTGSQGRIRVRPDRTCWCGEHWVARVRNGDGHELVISLYLTRWSPAGEGHTALVRLPSPDPVEAILTDAPAVTAYLLERDTAIIRYQSRNEEWANVPVEAATFKRSGSLSEAAAWTLRRGDRDIRVSWEELEPPVMLWAEPPGQFGERDLFSLLVFAPRVTVAVSGRRYDYRPYTTDVWEPTLGGQRSSCVIGLAETFVWASDERP